MDKLQQLEEKLNSIKDDYKRGAGGNKAAGTRVRKAMQEIKAIAQEIRQEMLDARESEQS